MALVELQDLVKSYGAVGALNKLNMEIPENSLYGLLGPNGSGKSTTLKIICTLLAPDSGTAIIAGVDVLKNPRYIRQNIGYVAQEIAIDKILSGRELLQLHGDLYHLSRNDRDLRIEELVHQLDMGEWIDRRSGSYSGGMKRRLDLASGLLHQPKLLILDEPTVGLDIESRSTIWNLLRDLREKGTTILLSSHYLEEVDALADYMAIIDKGVVIGQGSPQELKEKLGGNRITLKVREFSDEKESQKIRQLVKEIEGVGEVVVNRAQGFSLNLVVDNQDVLPKLRQKLTDFGFDVFALSESRPSLDDVYLQATGRTIADVELEVAGKRDLKGEAKNSMR